MSKKGKKHAPVPRTAVSKSQGTDTLPSVGWSGSAGTDEKNDNRPGRGKTWAPYNFVPFSNKVLLPYPGGLDSLPGHDEIRPDLKTGEIQITLTAETPMFVSDGQRGNASFFRGANGKLMIPGSTIRGLVRENMQILGFGLIRPGEDLEDRRIYFREMAAGRNTLRFPLKAEYKEALGIGSEVSRPGSSIKCNGEIKAGFLCKEGNDYYIYPTSKTYGMKKAYVGNYAKIRRSHPGIKRFLSDYEKNRASNVFPVYYCYGAGGKEPWIYDTLDCVPSEKREKYREGTLLIRPKNVFLFPLPVRYRSDAIHLSESDILSYQSDLEHSRKLIDAEGKSHTDDFQSLPDDNETKPVFYVDTENGHAYFGTSLYKCSTLERVEPGYICHEDGVYRIYRTVGNRYFRVSPDNPSLRKFKLEDTTAHYGRQINVEYSGSSGSLKLYKLGEKHEEDTQKGVLLYTGKPISNANHVYLFPEVNKTGECVKKLMPNDPEILNYRVDFEERENSLKAYNNANVWRLPDEGEEKAIFFVNTDTHLYFGMSLFLRIGYRHTIAEGLPAYHRDRNQQQEEQVDYPHGILGFSNQANSYRSRVSVEDFTLTAGGETIQEIPYTPGGPKPSFYPGYLRDAPREKYGLPPVSPETKHYNDSSFLLRGYKQYWLRDTAVTPLPPKRVDAASTVKLRLLPAGAVFTGVIRYKNLTEQELGLLLWSIRLDDSCYHSIGMGKPYGFGRMKVQIQNLLEVQPDLLYGGLAGPSPVLRGTETTAERVDGYIKRYDESAEKLLESLEDTLKLPVTETDSIRNRPEIQDFLHMKSTLVQSAEGDGESLYMSIDKDDYRNLTKPLPTVAELRQTEAAAEEAANRSMDD